MLTDRLKSWLLAVGLQLVLVATASAQGQLSQGVPAFAPGEVEDLQLFDQPDLSAYGSAMRAPEGWFVGVESLAWYASQPLHTQIGLNGASREVYVNNSTPGLNNASAAASGVNGGAAGVIPSSPGTTNPAGVQFVTDTNTADTGYIKGNWHTGVRADIGYIDGETDRGWLFSAFNLNGGQNMTLDETYVHMVFQEPLVPVYDGVQGGTIYLPILYGFVDQTGSGVANDLNRNNLYGPSGRDRGVAAASVLQTGTTLSGAPTREGAVDVLTGAGVLTNGFGPATGTTVNGGTGPYANFINQGPAPGAPPVTIAGTVMNGTKQPVDYGDAVPLPVIFSRLQSSDRNWTYSLEANRMWRVGTDRFGTTFDLFMGARYLDFDEIFQVIGTGGTLANSWWQAGDNNHILGGQFGMRTRRQWDRLVFNTELRLVTAADFQTASVKGVIGTELTQTTVSPVTTFTTVTVPTTAVSPAPTTTNQLIFVTTQPNNPGQGVAATRLNQPLNLLTTGFATTAHPVTFAPMGEARLNWSYQLFSGVSLNFGYTGLMAYGVGRPSRMINYTLPALSVNTLADKEVMVLTGLNAGVRFNY